MIRSEPAQAEARLERAGYDELDAVMQVMTRAFDRRFGEAWTRSQCAGILPMTGVSITLARDGAQQPVGFSLYRTIAGESELLLIAVMPECRGRGIARQLLGQFLDQARADGASRVHLEVRDGNPAVRIYEEAGFTAVRRRPNYYRGCDREQFDALTLARDI